MNRPLSALALASIAALFVAACGDDHHHGYDEVSASGAADCSAYTTCGECTPVLGCGWCDYGDGSGSCTAGPSMCVGNEFSWTWDPPGCGLTSTGTGDAAATTDAGAATDAPTLVTVDTGTGIETGARSCVLPVDVGDGCAITTGGTLCGEGDYSVGCHGGDAAAPAPSEALSCVSAGTSSSATDQYFCCPCLQPGR